MYNADFDPMQQLIELQTNQLVSNKNILELTRSINALGELIKKLIDQMNYQTQAIKNLDYLIDQLEKIYING
jgi:hypothetical protein